MSLQAELVLLGARWFIKRHGRQKTTIAQMRRRLAAAKRLVPGPSADTETIGVDAGGARADRITTPASEEDRHVVHLYGGGFITGSPPLYRHLIWRIASAARACVLSIDYRLAPEYPFPAALDDAVTAHHWLLAEGADPRRMRRDGRFRRRRSCVVTAAETAR